MTPLNGGEKEAILKQRNFFFKTNISTKGKDDDGDDDDDDDEEENDDDATFTSSFPYNSRVVSPEERSLNCTMCYKLSQKHGWR